MPTLSLFRRAEAPPVAAAEGRIAIIDIGSNSIRLVVYDGPARSPSILFNEKVLAGLGAGLAKSGRIEAEAADRALAALARFRRLALQMEVATLRTVATAAVRDASNGSEFLSRLAKIGLDVELLSGDEEAAMAGYGVLAAIPEADGIVGDLGGGSLELIRVGAGEVRDRASFPLGVLRLEAIRRRGPRALDRVVAAALKKAGWASAARGLPFYLVGGSWRALARLDMTLTDFPLGILHHYRFAPGRPSQLVRTLRRMDKKRLKGIEGLSSQRAATLPDAAALLAILDRRLGPSEMIVSAYGLREGLLHHRLTDSARAEDPLIAATREEGRRQGRFPEHGDLLDRWIAPLFADESEADGKLRRATCLLADIGWRAHPDFRANRGLETALHGNWVGTDAAGRATMAQALWVGFGGNGVPDAVAALIDPATIARASRWGLALRLGQRLSGGVAGALEASRLHVAGNALVLTLDDADEGLYGEAVVRRHKVLVGAMGLQAKVVGG